VAWVLEEGIWAVGTYRLLIRSVHGLFKVGSSEGFVVLCGLCFECFVGVFGLGIP